MTQDADRIIYAVTAIAAGDLFDKVPSARMDICLMGADPNHRLQAATIAALKERNLIDHGERPHDETLRALVCLAGVQERTGKTQ